MGLADFLATAGQGKTLGHVAEAFGGQTSQQKAVDDFINNQLPALADQIHKASSKEDVAKAGQSLITSGLKAGINPQGLDKLMEMTIQPALRNMQMGELEKLRGEYAAQPAIPAESRPPGTEGPLTPSGNFIDPKAATPEKPLDLNFMMRFGQATGANPAQFNQMLGTPVENAGKQLSNQKTQQAIDQETATQNAIKNLPATREGGQPSQQEVAQINRPGITQFLDQRAKAEDPLQEKRSQVMDAQIANLNHLANRPYPTPGGEAHGSAEYQDYIKLLPSGQPPTMEGFQQYLEQRRSAGKPTETTADAPYGSIDREIDLKTIAKEAHAQGKTTPEDIKKIAARRGVVIEGDPQLTGGRNWAQRAVGAGEEPTLTGNFQIKRAPRVTTRTKTPPGQGRYSEGIPSGSAPAAQAGGRGRGQSPTPQSAPAPKRLKFDEKGNLIQ